MNTIKIKKRNQSHMWQLKNAEFFDESDWQWCPQDQQPRYQVPDDIAVALQRLLQFVDAQYPEIVPFFDRREPLIAARAPGRLDLMGGIADYSGSTVLQLPLSESAVVLSQTTSDSMVRVISVDPAKQDLLQRASMPVEHFFDAQTGQTLSPASMHHYFCALDDDHQWAAYIAGVLPVLMEQCGSRLEQGLALFVYSTVPQGKGVSSSAAIEVATMRAVSTLSDLRIDAHQQAVLCQRVENQVVGAPCGLMDQMTSSLGRQNALLRLLCQPDIVEEFVSLPSNLSVWGIDSGVRHHVSGTDYTAVRVASFMGYRWLLDYAGIAGQQVLADDVADTKWRGYLANVSVSEYEEHYQALLPTSQAGADFLSRFDAITDLVTRVDPDVVYAVKACTEHPIREHDRVQRFAELSLGGHDETVSSAAALQMGQYLYESHASYSACGLGSPGTDELVSRLQQAGPDKGIFGARITGGGSGGTVAVLADSSAEAVVLEIAKDYASQNGIGGQVFCGSSDGASVWRLSPVSG